MTRPQSGPRRTHKASTLTPEATGIDQKQNLLGLADPRYLEVSWRSSDLHDSVFTRPRPRADEVHGRNTPVAKVQSTAASDVCTTFEKSRWRWRILTRAAPSV